jgi:hypothetical protein
MACKVTRYDCTDNSAQIRELGKIADSQQDAFKSIFPWKKQCEEASDHIHYVAQSPNGIICGWLTARLVEEFGQHYMYLNEISTRRIKDELYGGVGLTLHAALVKDAKEAGVDFIYLYPLNPEVAAIYKRAEWGYTEQRPEIVQLFLILRAPPNRAMLDSVMPPNPRSFMTMAYSIISQMPQDDALMALYSRVRRWMIKKPELIRQLSEAIDMVKGVQFMEKMEGIPKEDRTTLDQKRALIAEVLNKVKIGGSRTFKNKKPKKSRRRTRLRPFGRT